MDQLSEKLAGIPEFPDVKTNHWRYEFAIWHMFWLWYVAISPRLAKQNGGNALLDSYYRSCYESIARAGLLTYGQTDFSFWRGNLEQRFFRYKRAFEYKTPWPRAFSGTVGDEFSKDFYQDEAPHPKLAIILNEAGSVRLQLLTNMVVELEKQYSN